VSDNNRPRVLIEQWLPIDQIGAECMRERGASSALPPLYFLHVWWARRPLTVSRAAILASLLPAYPVEDDKSVRPWPQEFLKAFPKFEDYKCWFLRLIGVVGDSAGARRLLEWAKLRGKKIANPYDGPRAFTVNPDQDSLEQMYDLLEWTWGSREITFCDPMSGGGSIPFEALRFGLTVYANELNPVASVVLRATLDYPARFGSTLVDRLLPYGKAWSERVRERLKPYFSSVADDSVGACYLWSRTVACPTTGKPVPLSPHWWLRKGASPVAVKVVAAPTAAECHFEVVHGKTACAKAKPDQGTVKRGTGLSPWTSEAIDGDYIKAEAQAGRMGEQLFAVAAKRDGGFQFRSPTSEDYSRFEASLQAVEDRSQHWEAGGLIPNEPRRAGRADWCCEIYGMTRWSDTYSPRQLLSMVTMVEVAREVCAEAQATLTEEDTENADTLIEALHVVLALAIDKAADYNSKQASWDVSRQKVGHAFTRHDLSMRWSFSEFDGAGNLAPWCLDQVFAAVRSMGDLAYQPTLFGDHSQRPVERLTFTNGPAQQLSEIATGSIRSICVDPPYYDNVNYAECSNYFYVWQKRTLGAVFPRLFSTELANADDEAVMNKARFADMGSKATALATADYENKMMSCFQEMHRILADEGVLTVMFTHKQVEAWDTLGMALLRAGFRIDASWPVHTESEVSLHQAKKNAAASTIMLACRKREDSGEPVWWDDLKSHVRAVAREKAEQFEAEGISGVDLYISTFGPVLSIISEKWPVLTSETDPKTGDPLPLKPGDALDLAREEVVNLRKQGLLLGRTVEFDPVTDWYLMAWDAFKAQEFPADEARKLAIALGLDLERDLIRDKRLVAKKSASVVVALPGDRRKRNMVDDDAETFVHLIDALHTAMMVYEEEGSKACQVFLDRTGLRTDSRLKALVQACMEAIPTTRGKDGEFLRPEMTTLEAMRLLFWADELPAPKEEEPVKLDEGRLTTPDGEVWLSDHNDSEDGEDDQDEEDSEE